MVPRCSNFELLLYFTDRELERKKLIKFTSGAGQEELYNYCNRPERTILEVWLIFSILSLYYIFELF